jgi:hypothetical protein
LHFLKLLERPRFEDYAIQFWQPQNPFFFLGNGMHADETNNDGDLTWYFGNSANDTRTSRIRVLERVDANKTVSD